MSNPQEAVLWIVQGFRDIRDGCAEMERELGPLPPDSPLARLRDNVLRALVEYERGDAEMPLNPFAYHKPTEGQAQRMEAITERAEALWVAMQDLIRPCPEKEAALTRLRECRMWANAGVLFGDAAAAEAPPERRFALNWQLVDQMPAAAEWLKTAREGQLLDQAIAALGFMLCRYGPGEEEPQARQDRDDAWSIFSQVTDELTRRHNGDDQGRGV